VSERYGIPHRGWPGTLSAMPAITRSHVARRLGISKSHVIRLEQRGELTPTFVDGAHRFDADELERLATKRAAKRATPSRPSITTAAAMRLLQLSRAQLRRLEMAGDVRAVRVGGARHFDLAEIERLAAERTVRRGGSLAASDVPATSKLARVPTPPASPQAGAAASPGGLVVTADQLADLRRALCAKVPSAAALVAHVKALADDYSALEDDFRAAEHELADRVTELAEARTAAHR
jgi:DNA-binding transcriptional MerR regulator